MYSFNEIWAQKPKREGSNPRKRAERAYNARLDEGVDPKDMMSGMMRYAKYCDEKGIEGSAYVMQCATFLGPDHHFQHEWRVFKPETHHKSIEEELSDRSWAGL